MRIIALGFVVLACGFGACAQNEGTPFVPANLSAAGSGGDAAGSGGRTEAGRAGSAAGRGGAGGSGGMRQTNVCLQRAKTWQGDTRQEDDLSGRIDQLRANGRSCGFGWPFGPQGPIKDDDSLQCTAQLFFQMTPRGPSPASFMWRHSSGSDGARDLQERLVAADVPFDVFELIVTGADRADDVMFAIQNAPEGLEVCGTLMSAPKVGIAHAGSVWVIELMSPTQNSPAHSGPMPGDH